METYTITQIAKFLSVTEGTVRRWIRDGKLIACKEDGQQKISKDDFEAFMIRN